MLAHHADLCACTACSYADPCVGLLGAMQSMFEASMVGGWTAQHHAIPHSAALCCIAASVPSIPVCYELSFALYSSMLSSAHSADVWCPQFSRQSLLFCLSAFPHAIHWSSTGKLLHGRQPSQLAVGSHCHTECRRCSQRPCSTCGVPAVGALSAVACWLLLVGETHQLLTVCCCLLVKRISFVFLWTMALSPNREAIKHGLIFTDFMTASMVGSFLAGILMKRARPEAYMKYVFGVGAVALLVPTIINLDTRRYPGECSMRARRTIKHSTRRIRQCCASVHRCPSCTARHAFDQPSACCSCLLRIVVDTHVYHACKNM